MGTHVVISPEAPWALTSRLVGPRFRSQSAPTPSRHTPHLSLNICLCDYPPTTSPPLDCEAPQWRALV